MIKIRKSSFLLKYMMFRRWTNLRRIRKTPIKELIKENIRSLLSDKEELARIEEKLEARLMK